MTTNNNKQQATDNKQQTMETCRICFEDEDPSKLISPCHCAGFSRYVHTECVIAWINTSNRTTCEVCKSPFQLRLDEEEQTCAPTNYFLILLVNPFFHIFLQYLGCVFLAKTQTYSTALHLFLTQHLLTIAFYALYVLLGVRNLRRYRVHCDIVPTTPLLVLHATLFLTLLLSRDVVSITSPPLLVLFMTGCNMLICVYPIRHMETIADMNQNRRARLQLYEA